MAKEFTLQFNPGDLVGLRSGSPTMTVQKDVSANASSATGVNIGVHCAWFVNGQVQFAVFTHEALVPRPGMD